MSLFRSRSDVFAARVMGVLAAPKDSVQPASFTPRSWVLGSWIAHRTASVTRLYPAMMEPSTCLVAMPLVLGYSMTCGSMSPVEMSGPFWNQRQMKNRNKGMFVFVFECLGVYWCACILCVCMHAFLCLMFGYVLMYFYFACLCACMFMFGCLVMCWCTSILCLCACIFLFEWLGMCWCISILCVCVHAYVCLMFGYVLMYFYFVFVCIHICVERLGMYWCTYITTLIIIRWLK